MAWANPDESKSILFIYSSLTIHFGGIILFSRKSNSLKLQEDKPNVSSKFLVFGDIIYFEKSQLINYKANDLFPPNV